MREPKVHLVAGDRTVCGRPAGDLPVTEDPTEASCRGCLNPPEAGHGGGESRAAQRRRSRREGMAGVDQRGTHPDRLASSGPEPFGACPDEGRCWHGCPLTPGGAEGKGAPCWRVLHASPLTAYGETWPAEVTARHLHAEAERPV